MIFFRIIALFAILSSSSFMICEPETPTVDIFKGFVQLKNTLKTSIKNTDAVTVSTYATIPWFLHGFHGYCQRYRNYLNIDTPKYPRFWNRCKAFDFSTFNKWHPIQSLKGSKHMMIPLVGPIIAANMTGMIYHGLTTHTYGSWKAKNTNSNK